jgi:hypothetical protein
LSKQHGRFRENNFLFSAALEPAGSAVFLFGNFVSARDQMFIEHLVVALGAKFVRELIREFVGRLNTLNAALLQKSAPRPALSCASDFAPIRQNVRADRIREAVSVVIGVADAGIAVSDCGYNCIPAF